MSSSVPSGNDVTKWSGTAHWDIEDWLNADDPSGLRSTEDKRASEILRDYDAAVKRIVKDVGEMTSPDALQIQRIVDRDLEGFNQATKDKMTKWLNDTYLRTVKWTDRALKQSGIITVGSLLPGAPLDVQKALAVGVENDIESLTADTRKVISRELVQGIAQGEGIRELRNRITEATDLPRARAELIARTETMKAFRDTAVERYKRYGVEQVKWIATPDEATCDECMAHDGQIYDIEDIPDEHPNGRCITIPVIKEEAS